jgi:anti-sigma B factor antagonist
MEPRDVARAGRPASDDSVGAGRRPATGTPSGVPRPAELVLGEPSGQEEQHYGPEPASWGRALIITMADGGRVVVALAGEIDIANAGYLRAELAYLIDSGRTDLVADLTGVTSISSSGLGVLVGALKRVRPSGGRLELVASSEALLRILRITRLTHVFAIHPTLQDALAP